ncbi:YoaK family protein [Sediminitomix flava]|uniref:Uncharacterized membrane protein YoaK (UPF0700 family) n=1 Tax=Sediminitomix flava TaxID=379075 RepID=A0A316A2G9_SEDFL|nr:YoaK family protein [Sediminitomix flava]PWJ43897.1 uncharacterized membrane protein YoaK (UPF0700 family) [Sediminitomix flava]
MYKQQGDKREFLHDVSMAAILSGIAGLVGITGFLAFGILPTNVTGHVADFSVNFAQNFVANSVLWIAAFYSGAFFCSWYLDFKFPEKKHFPYVFPIFIEMLLLIFVGFAHTKQLEMGIPDSFFASILLFAMGLQNALVTKISGAVVRTTHMTGLLTDLAIETSRLFNHKSNLDEKTSRSILLRLTILFCFIIGGVIGYYLHERIAIFTFIVPAVVLGFTIIGELLATFKILYKRQGALPKLKGAIVKTK